MMSSFQLGFLILLSSAVLIIASSSSAADAQQEIIQSIIHRENVGKTLMYFIFTIEPYT
jgi:hypothetical protein